MAQPPEGMAPAFAAQYLKIRQAFVAGLPQRMEHILQAADPQARYVALHQLAGAAGSYGFSALSAMARACMEARHPGADLALAAALQNLAQAIAELQCARH